MNRFFDAQSVAIIGVSTTPTNLGQLIVHNLLRFDYQGVIYPVGPKGGSVLGHKIYSTVCDIPGSVELAAILVPALVVPEILRQCGENGIGRIVIESSGFSELGKERLALEKEIHVIVERYSMRIVGPNCIGVINRLTGLALPFMLLSSDIPTGRAAIVSQSGGVGAAMINSLASENMGFSKFVSVGNKLNVNENDLLEYLVQDDETDIVFCYLEGIADGRHLMEIASRSSKPIIIHKSNTGAPSSIIAKTHSASLSTNDRIVSEAFRQCGILRVHSQREGIERLKGLSLPRMAGNRLGIISRSGGQAVIAADAAGEFGFELPPFPESLIEMVKLESRAKVIQLHNPLDLGDLFNIPFYRTLVEESLGKHDIDGLVFIYNYNGVLDAKDSRELILSLGEVIAKTSKPLALCLFTNEFELDHIRRAADFPIFEEPREAVRALAINRDRRLRRPNPFLIKAPEGINLEQAQSELVRTDGSAVPPEILASVLSAFGIPLVPWKRAGSQDEVLAAARRLGFPVVLKTAQPKVIHKSEANGVYLNLQDEDALKEAYRRLLKIGPNVLVERMAEDGLEWIVGGHQDSEFGPVLVVGLGGVYVEVLRDVGMRIAPIGYEEANRLLDELRGASLLGGMRGQNARDRRALLEVIVRVSWFLTNFPEIRELDLNPVRTFEKGCLVLDWRASFF